MLILIFFVIGVFVSLYRLLSFLKRERDVVKKYPFFQLKDEIMYLLIKDGTDNELLKRYELIEHLISDIKKIDFNFFVIATAEVIKPLLDENIKYRAQIQAKQLSKNTRKIDTKLIKLLLQAGKQNSIRLRLAMTRFGSHILLARAFFHLRKHHPEIFIRRKQQIETLQTYADLVKNKDSYCLA